MKVKIRIKTPKGQAKGTESKIKPLIIGLKKVKIDSYVNDDDNELIWDIEGSYRDILKIQRNAAMFSTFITRLLKTKILKKTLRKELSPEGEKELVDMLVNHTSCEVIKAATEKEFVDGNKTWWDKVKETFHKNVSEEEEMGDEKNGKV
jgi:hypothetical protein